MKTILLLLLPISVFCQEPKKNGEYKQYRSAKSGQYVTKQKAETHKSTTVSETRKGKK